MRRIKRPPWESNWFDDLLFWIEWRVGWTSVWLAIILIVFLTFSICVLPAKSASNDTVNISIWNPYRITLGCEVKCDWNNKTRKFDYYNNIIVPGKGKYILKVGKQYKDCEVWGKVLFFENHE